MKTKLIHSASLGFCLAWAVGFAGKAENVQPSRAAFRPPNYAANPAIWIYYEAAQTTIQNARIRWSQRGIQEDEDLGYFPAPAINSSTFMNCNIGVYANVANDTLYLSSDTGCNLVTPVSRQSGTVSEPAMHLI